MLQDKVISGKFASEQVKQRVEEEVAILKRNQIKPCLAVILVGHDPASQIYVNNKKKTCKALGIHSESFELTQNTTQKELEELIVNLNNDEKIHGILCQLPLPSNLNEDSVIQTISPQKDVDGLNPFNVGLLASGKAHFVPCTPLGVLQMLYDLNTDLAGQHVVILGRSQLVGRPLSLLLSQKGIDCTVTLCHSQTKNLSAMTKQADILIAAIGKPNFVTQEMVKTNAIVIDVGINRVDDSANKKGYRICGDVNFDQVLPICSQITPVPGGVGLMTVAMLMFNTVNAARLQNKLDLLQI